MGTKDNEIPKETTLDDLVDILVKVAEIESKVSKINVDKGAESEKAHLMYRIEAKLIDVQREMKRK